MLRVNEDMLLAAAECHGDRDVDGALAYDGSRLALALLATELMVVHVAH